MSDIVNQVLQNAKPEVLALKNALEEARADSKKIGASLEDAKRRKNDLEIQLLTKALDEKKEDIRALEDAIKTATTTTTAPAPTPKLTLKERIKQLWLKYRGFLLFLIFCVAIGYGIHLLIQSKGAPKQTQQSACLAAGGVFDSKTHLCVVKEQPNYTREEYNPQSSNSTSNSTPSNSNLSGIPDMKWSNGTLSRSYQPQPRDNMVFWEMDPYDHTDAGEAYLTIRDFKEITFNNVSDGEGYVIEILDKNGETIHVFKEHSNNFNDNRWWEVQPGWDQIHFVWTDRNNASNSCMMFARP